MLHIEPEFFPFCALLLLIIPFPWLCSIFFAAFFHECCHIAAIHLLGGRIRKIRIGICKAEIETEISGLFVELLCALAGPLGSFSLICLQMSFPRLALCGAIHGIFNFLPLYPLDGGRILYCITALISPKYADTLCHFTETVFILLFLILSLWSFFFLSSGPVPILIFLHLLYNRKKTCKA